MSRLPIAAASAVTISSLANALSTPVIALPSTCGLTNSTYDIVRNVVSPARSSRGTVEPARAIPKYASIARLFVPSAFRAAFAM
jgi:hypothetical protein